MIDEGEGHKGSRDHRGYRVEVGIMSQRSVTLLSISG